MNTQPNIPDGPRPISNGVEPEANQDQIQTEAAPVPEMVQEAAPASSRPPLGRVIVGAIFLAVSLVGGMGLVVAALPSLPTRGEANIAAAQAAPHDAYQSLQLEGKGIYITDLATGKVLFAREPDAQLPLASLTKVALALVVSEVLSPEEIITISRSAVIRGEGGLTMGEEWLARDLIDYMLIASSNTAAEGLAEAAEGRLRGKYPEAPRGEAAVWRMNSLAERLGLQSTYFVNASGLDESTTQAGALGSSKDIAGLFAYALRANRSLFAGTVRAGEVVGPLNMPKKEAHNTNEVLSSIPNIIMGKTGLTDLAGGNLAIVFDAGVNHPVVIVVLSSTPEGRFEDMKKLVATTLHVLAVETKLRE